LYNHPNYFDEKQVTSYEPYESYNGLIEKSERKAIPGMEEITQIFHEKELRGALFIA